MEPRLSIVIPCYNQAAWLGCAVESALAQEGAEAVIVNDGSTDATPGVARDFAGREPDRIRLIEHENRGLSAARQSGLEAARGEAVWFLDADDQLAHGAARAALAALEADPEAAGAAGAVQMTDEEGRELPGLLEPGLPLLWPAVADCNPIGAPHMAVLRRPALEKLGGCAVPGARACEDWDLWARMARAGMRLISTGRLFGFYRQHPGTLSRDPELMLREQIACIGRMAAVDPRLENLAGFAPPLSPAQAARAVNGCVLYALGGAVAGGAELGALSGKLQPGFADVEYLRKRFAEGARHALMTGPGKIPGGWKGSVRAIRDALAPAMNDAEARALGGAVEAECAHLARLGSPLRRAVRKILGRP